MRSCAKGAAFSIFCLGIWLNATPAFPDDLDPASAEAVQKTMQLLQSNAERSKEIEKDPEAQLVDRQVKALGGSPQTTEAIYGLSADIFQKLSEKSGGDALKMQEMLKSAKEDPKAFYESVLSDAERAKLHQISTEISGPTAQPQMRAPAQIK